MDKIGILAQLNEKQKEACQVIEGPLLILAGAGSGKTRTITYRIAYLIASGINPINILAVTFTNKSAEEMKQRVQSLIGDRSSFMTMGTFHSICSRILRKHAELLGFTSNYAIYDQKDSINLIKKIISNLDLPKETFKPKHIKNIIGKLKRELISPEQYEKSAYSPNMLKIAIIYREYIKYLKLNNSMDFDDLISKTVLLLEKYPEIKLYYNNKFKFILVDEYQDTNKIQFELINLLSDVHNNICVVGDDDQSIYSFRGANIENILSFDQVYKNTKTIRLEQNYRSTKNILKAASSVIVNNVERKGKTLFSDWKNGEKLNLIESYSSMEEASTVMEEVKKLNKRGVPLGNLAILYRTNAQSRSLEMAAQKFQIPYIIVGNVKFFERVEIKNIIAYLNILANPKDNMSLLRIINVPVRGIGKKATQTLEFEAHHKGKSILDIIPDIASLDIPLRSIKAINNFYSMYIRIKNNSKNKGVRKTIEIILEETDYIDKMYNKTDPEDVSRIENIEELLNSANEYDIINENGNNETYLQQVSLFTDIDRWKEVSDRINMMTVHSAKGLEFTGVFVVGAMDGLFPHIINLESNDKIEEERRLFYVALTRAKEYLTITYSRTRDFHGSINPSIPSRFIKEIPETLFKNKPYFKYSNSLPEEPKDNIFETNSDNNLAIHPVFGKIRVIKTLGNGDQKRAYIHLTTGEKKWILLKYAKLTRMEK